jgi:septal ring factor EnvC (AmiA/AmiB activator)
MVALVNKKVTKALEAMETLGKKVEQQKQDFDALLESSDKSVKEYFADIKKQRESDQQKIKELEDKIHEYEQKKVSETQTLEVRVDNLEDKIKPAYKGHGKHEVSDSKPLTHDPTTGRPRQ